MTKDEFQQRHGARWLGITGDPAFLAAMQMAYEDKLQSIAVLTPAEIQTHAVPILASLQGHLEHENKLMELAVPDHDPSGLPPEDYAGDTDEGAEPTVESQTISSGPFVEFQQEQAAAPPRPAPRRKRRKRRKRAAAKKPPSPTQTQIIKTNQE